MVWTPPRSGKWDRQQHFSDGAIQTCLSLKVLSDTLHEAAGIEINAVMQVALTSGQSQ